MEMLINIGIVIGILIIVMMSIKLLLLIFTGLLCLWAKIDDFIEDKKFKKSLNKKKIKEIKRKQKEK